MRKQTAVINESSIQLRKLDILRKMDSEAELFRFRIRANPKRVKFSLTAVKPNTAQFRFGEQPFIESH